MAKKKVRAAFDIVDPPSNCLLGAGFGVYGNCSELGAHPDLTVTVNLTLTKPDGTVVMRSETATTNDIAQTWEAFFDNVPASKLKSGKIVAHCSVGGTQTAPSDQLTIATVIEAGLDVDFPNNGDIVTGPIGPIPLAKKSSKKSAKVAAAPKAKGKHLSAATVVAYVTKAGKRMKATETPVNSAPALLGKKKWDLDLNDVFKAQVTSGRFGLHYRIKNGAKTHRVSRGSFVVGP